MNIQIKKYRNLGYQVSKNFVQDGEIIEFEKTYIGVSKKEAIRLFKEDAENLGLVFITENA